MDIALRGDLSPQRGREPAAWCCIRWGQADEADEADGSGTGATCSGQSSSKGSCCFGECKRPTMRLWVSKREPGENVVVRKPLDKTFALVHKPAASNRLF